MKIAEPIVEKIQDNIRSLTLFEHKVSKINKDEEKNIVMRFPVVYIHNWKDKKENQYEVYVGESNNIFNRTKQHYKKMNDKSGWQYKLLDEKANLYIIGHEHFNKSMTMEIETRLIHYLTSVKNIRKVHNEKCNPQKYYYPENETDYIFKKIWNKLRKDNKEMFPLESDIKDSAIFKASPLHNLTEEQQEAKEKILDKIVNSLKGNKRGQLIFIEGEAGTGKTVLNSSTFYELLCRYEEEKENSENKEYEIKNCFLLVNHDEQITVYRQIFDKLGITDKFGQVVSKPTSFINKHSIDNPADVVFVDEAHLLLTQGKQSYTGKNQLKDIIDRSKVVIVMFDEEQVLTTEQYLEPGKIKEYRSESSKNGNYIRLEKQLRMLASDDIMDWINSFTKDGLIKKLPDNLESYDIKIFESPDLLYEEIKKKSLLSDSKLSRVIATYDWPYIKDNHNGCSEKFWEVRIGNWHKPWNRELENDFDRKQKRAIKNLAWAEQPQTINEVGSTYTIQGFDLNYAGVILGPSVKYRNGHIVFDPSESCNEKATRNRTLDDGTVQKFGEELLKHEVRVLMTRGVNGLYIYACDSELREQLKKCTGNYLEYKIYEDDNEGEYRYE